MACTTVSASSAAWDTFVSAVVPETWATASVRLASDVSLDAATCVSTSAWKLLRNGLVALVELLVVLDTAVALVITSSCCTRTLAMMVSGSVRAATTLLLVALVPLPVVVRLRLDISIDAPFDLTSVISPSTVVVSTTVVTLNAAS